MPVVWASARIAEVLQLESHLRYMNCGRYLMAAATAASHSFMVTVRFPNARLHYNWLHAIIKQNCLVGVSHVHFTVEILSAIILSSLTASIRMFHNGASVHGTTFFPLIQIPAGRRERAMDVAFHSQKPLLASFRFSHPYRFIMSA